MSCPQSFSETQSFMSPRKKSACTLEGFLTLQIKTRLVPEASRQKVILFSCRVTGLGLQHLHFYFIFPLNSQGRVLGDHTSFVKIDISVDFWASSPPQHGAGRLNLVEDQVKDQDFRVGFRAFQLLDHQITVQIESFSRLSSSLHQNPDVYPPFARLRLLKLHCCGLSRA